MHSNLLLIKNNWILVLIILGYIGSFISVAFYKGINDILKARLDQLKDDLQKQQDVNKDLIAQLDNFKHKEIPYNTEEIFSTILNLINLRTKKSNTFNYESIIEKHLHIIGNNIQSQLKKEEKSNSKKKNVNIEKLQNLYYIHSNDIHNSIEHMKKITRKFPNNSENLRILGILYMHNGEYQRANDIFNECLNIPENRKLICINNNLGQIYTHLKNFDLAQKYFNDALSIKDEDNFLFYLPHYNMGIMNYLKGNTSLEEECYYKALEYNSTHYKSYYNLACIYANQEKIPLAISNLRFAYTANPIEVELIAKDDKDIAPLLDYPNVKKYLSKSTIICDYPLQPKSNSPLMT